MKANLLFWNDKAALRVVVEHRGKFSPSFEVLLRAALPSADCAISTTSGMSGDTTRYTLWLPCTFDSLHPVVVGAVQALRDVGIDVEVSP